MSVGACACMCIYESGACSRFAMPACIFAYFHALLACSRNNTCIQDLALSHLLSTAQTKIQSCHRHTLSRSRACMHTPPPSIHNLAHKVHACIVHACMRVRQETQKKLCSGLLNRDLSYPATPSRATIPTKPKSACVYVARADRLQLNARARARALYLLVRRAGGWDHQAPIYRARPRLPARAPACIASIFLCFERGVRSQALVISDSLFDFHAVVAIGHGNADV